MPYAKPPLHRRFLSALLKVAVGFALMACAVPFLSSKSVLVQVAIGVPLLAIGVALTTLVFGTRVQWYNRLYPPKR